MYGQYILHAKLGEGGYSTVYKCTDNIGVRYACKMLPKDRNARSRVHNEVDILKRLNNSPKIVRLHDVGENAEAYYIIQEWCRGGTVKDYITEYENYGENTVASIVRGVLRGLVHMNEQGMIHRDIKGANIFLGDKSDDADVKIGDLGTAMQMHGEVMDVEELIGTVWFLPPESLSRKYHLTSDVWSLGVMTYQLLSGKMPFNDFENPFRPRIPVIWKRILTDDPKMTGKRWESVSQDAKDFISMCLNKDYKQRPTASQCLNHRWLTQTDCNDRFKGTPLQCQPFKYDDNSIMNAKTLRIKY